MSRSRTNILLLLLLLTVSFSLATLVQPRTDGWSRRSGSDTMLQILMGDGRRLFASHFFTQADVSFHAGYYPSIFEQANKAPKDTRHLTQDTAPGAAHNSAACTDPSHHHESGEEAHEAHAGEAGNAAGHDEEHMKAMAMERPRDWIERFGRRFIVTDHKHLEGGKEREMLPWLRISAELDPQHIETYTVAAYWLRDLQKYQEAEQFLREGLRHNPNSYQILFELGRLYHENHKDNNRARNVWEAALKKWEQQETGKKEPDLLGLNDIAIHLARMEQNEGNFARALPMLELAQKTSPHPEALEADIRELRAKVAASQTR